MDETSDGTEPPTRPNSTEQNASEHREEMKIESLPYGDDKLSSYEPQAAPSQPTASARIPMSQAEITWYAQQVNIQYPTTSGAELYQIAEIVPRWRRDAFEDGLGEQIELYYGELAKRG